MIRLKLHANAARPPALGAALAAVGLACALAAPAAATRFKLAVEEAGVYRVIYEQLAAQGLEGAMPSAALALASGGEGIPLWVEDGGDGSFGPGDHLEFVGERLAGDGSYYNQFSRYNVYWLDTRGQGGPFYRPQEAAGAEACEPTGSLGWRHLEEDTLRVRFSNSGARAREIWYWARLAHSDKQAFVVALDLEGLDLDADIPVRLDLHLQGWSRLARRPDEVFDHELEILVGDRVLSRQSWNSSPGGHLAAGLEVPASELLAAAGRLLLRVPRRELESDPIVDVSLLNWIEVQYPRRSQVDTRMAQLRAKEGDDSICVVADSDGPARVYAGAARHQLAAGEARSVALGAGDASEGVPGDLTEEPTMWFAAGEPSPVVGIERDRPSDLGGVDRQADYLMIAHPSLLPAAGELAKLHRARGLAVAVVDVTDVYDEFGHGVVHPGAIRDFLRHAYRSWREPRPRYVLLVGDSSWDLSDEPADDANYAKMSFELATTFGVRNRRSPGDFRFRRHQARAYDEAGPAEWRNLIPTWPHPTLDGPAASDNWFVDVEGDDLRPELAIGRLPVMTADEVEVVVDKVRRQLTALAARTDSGPRSALLVTDQYEASMNHAESIGQDLEGEGYTLTKIYPEGQQASSPGHVSTVVEAFDANPQLVYFVGHGGRYEWRTGPPDLAGQTDLFTLDHVDELVEHGDEALPVVLSVACYSAPFDHPAADSIGEKLLRIPQRGAVAVVAAAWRITPSLATGQALIEHLLTAPTLGDALLAVKSTVSDFQFVVQFNLLGDPALPLASRAGVPDVAPGTVAQ